MLHCQHTLRVWNCHTHPFTRYTRPILHNSLAYYLCEGAGNLTNYTTIILSHTIIHYIPPGSFCLVENITGLTIYGDSSDNPAVVKCNSTSHHVRGFGFFNIANLSISNIVVENCGGVIDQDATKYHQ